jgi:hypothetical protein
MKLRSSLCFLLAGSALLAQAQFAPNLKAIPKELEKGFHTINVNDGKTFLGYLAGPECEGRGTGQPGFQKAMDYMAKHFKEFGLKPVMPDGSYFQLVDFYRVGVDSSSLLLKSKRYTAKAEEISVTRTGELDASGDVVFVSASGKITDSRTVILSDSQKLEVKDKVVLLINKSESRGLENALMAAGAKGIVTVVDKYIPPSFQGRQAKPSTFSSGRLGVTMDVVRKLFSKPDQDIISTPLQPNSLNIVSLSDTLSIGAKAQVETVKVGNVVAKLEGSDPVLKEEYIGVGAHLDHLGRSGDVINYGADDDGSGSTALLQLAKALTANPVKPKRTVIFMAFYGEEMGLLGSRYFSDNSPVPLNKMIAELQMDMVGRNSTGVQNGDPNRVDKEEENRDTIRLVGSKRISTALDKIILQQNESIGWKFKYDAEDVYTRSDHYNFARKGIPIAFFFTGFHPDYHQPTDTVEKINYDKIANTAKLVYLTIHELGNYNGMLPKDVQQTGGGR